MSIQFVSPEHAEILRHYLDDDATILVMPEMHDRATQAGFQDGDPIPEDYSEISDRVVDIVSSPTHYLLTRTSGDE